jgi:hypothetical protein
VQATGEYTFEKAFRVAERGCIGNILSLHRGAKTSVESVREHRVGSLQYSRQKVLKLCMIQLREVTPLDCAR